MLIDQLGDHPLPFLSSVSVSVQTSISICGGLLNKPRQGCQIWLSLVPGKRPRWLSQKMEKLVYNVRCPESSA